jgi:hypothetical protein
MSDEANEPLDARLAQADRAIRRAQLEEKIRELGGLIGRPAGEREEVSDLELTFLERVIGWETGPFSTHRAWLERHGLGFIPPAELAGPRLKAELWRLIESLAAVARVFLYHTNHLSDAELYHKLWHEVLAGDAPDFARTPDDACHWDLADASGSDESLQTWLTFHATERKRVEWVRDFPDTVLPPRRRAPYRRDHRLPLRS